MRYKCKLYLIFMFLCILLLGCNAKTLPDETSDVSALDFAKADKNAHQKLIANQLCKNSLGAEAGEKISVPNVGLYDVTISSQIGCNSVSDMSGNHSAYILTDFRYDTQMFHDSYLAVETENVTLFYDLGIRSIEDHLYANDINADGIDEIIVHHFVDCVGGAGSYLSRIFAVENDVIREIFCSDSYDASGNNNRFDTGYTSEFLENGKLKITNTNVDYSTIIDLSSRYSRNFFDGEGKGVLNIKISCDSFMEFVPTDVDDDGVFEIVCKQYVSLYGHADGIGYAISTLKFNSDSQMFEVIKAEFTM